MRSMRFDGGDFTPCQWAAHVVPADDLGRSVVEEDACVARG